MFLKTNTDKKWKQNVPNTVKYFHCALETTNWQQFLPNSSKKRYEWPRHLKFFVWTTGASYNGKSYSINWSYLVGLFWNALPHIYISGTYAICMFSVYEYMRTHNTHVYMWIFYYSKDISPRFLLMKQVHMVHMYTSGLGLSSSRFHNKNSKVHRYTYIQVV